MVLTLVALIISAILIYFSCELFVNGIEWVGLRFNISKNAVGTILAAFGTALPESVVTFIAVVFGVNANQKDIGVGAALGGPLVLSTIAYAIVGLGIIYFRKQRTQGLIYFPWLIVTIVAYMALAQTIKTFLSRNSVNYCEINNLYQNRKDEKSLRFSVSHFCYCSLKHRTTIEEGKIILPFNY